MERILFTLAVPVGRGGMEIVAAKVASLLESVGNKKIELFMFDEGEGAHTDWLGHLAFTLSKTSFRNGKVRQIIHSLRLAKKIRRFKPDIIITLNTIPCLISRRAIRLSKSNTKLVTWMHLPPAERYRPHYLALADHHLAISNEIAKQLIKLGISKNKIDVIFNPVTPKENIIHRPDRVNFLYIGRTHYEDQKRLKDMLEACARLTGEWSLNIIGDGEDKQKCQAYADELKIADNITWHGWQQDPWHYVIHNIGQVSALLLTSDHEGFPLILLEALSQGVYCIASDCVSGPSEVIIPDVNGVLYPPRNIEALSHAMQSIVDGKELPSHAGIKQSVEKFYDAKFMSNLVKVLESIH